MLLRSGSFAVLRGGQRAFASSADATIARTNQLFIDNVYVPAEGGATLAAYRQALRDGEVDEDEEVVLFNCATGLKYPLPAADQRLDRHAAIDFDRL